MPRPEPKYPWFASTTREQLYDLWLSKRGSVGFPRLVQAFAECFRHERHQTTDAECLATVAWALDALADARWNVTPEAIAGQWVRWLQIHRSDPWSRWDATREMTGAWR